MTPATSTTGTGATLPNTVGASGSPGSHVIQTTSSGAAGSGLKDGQCAKQNIVVSRVVPTIWLVIDGSGSMLSPLGGGSAQSRWSALYDALMNPDSGVVKSLEKDVQWGVVLYDGPPPGGVLTEVPLPDGGVRTLPPAETCPRVVVSEPKKEAFADISMIVGVDPLGGSTPTDRALDVVVNHLPDLTGQALDTRVFPTIVVLATDGEPNDFCNIDPFLGIPLGGDTRPKVLSAVTQLESMSVKTYVISLAGGDQNWS